MASTTVWFMIKQGNISPVDFLYLYLLYMSI